MKEEISINYIKSVLRHDEESGNLIWLKPVARRISAGDIAGTRRSNGYWIVCIRSKRYYVHRVVWLIHYGEWPSMNIDHIDGNQSNNRMSNLRMANQSQNTANISHIKKSESGVKGVYRIGKTDKWEAKIMRNYKTIRLGIFHSKQEAAEAYAKAAQVLFGEFAVSVWNPR